MSNTPYLSDQIGDADYWRISRDTYRVRHADDRYEVHVWGMGTGWLFVVSIPDDEATDSEHAATMAERLLPMTTIATGDVAFSKPDEPATDAERVRELHDVVGHWVTEANRLDDERGDDFDIAAEAEATALRSCAEAVLSVLHPDVDLTSPPARQTYIESGVFPTRTEVRDASVTR